MKGVMRSYYRAALGEGAKERLSRDLDSLALYYCREPLTLQKGTPLHEAMKQRWPPRELLESIEGSIKALIKIERDKPPRPLWRAFQLLDKRMSSLLLVRRVNILVKRGEDRLTESGESVLSKLERQARAGNVDARSLLRDIALLRNNLSAGKTIDWAQHEKVLAQFSRTGTVELTCDDSAAASQNVRCYARALELIVDDNQREPLREKSKPLVRWLARIGHPEAKHLEVLNHRAAVDASKDNLLVDHMETRRRREKARERDRRYRERKDSLPEKRRVMTR